MLKRPVLPSNLPAQLPELDSSKSGRKPATARHCTSCTHQVVLVGSVSLSEGRCASCRQRERERATATDLKRIHTETTRRAIELNKSGYMRDAEDWTNEALLISAEIQGRRERCEHNGIPFGVCSYCGVDASQAPMAECSVCGDTGFIFDLPKDDTRAAVPCPRCPRGAAAAAQDWTGSEVPHV